MPEEIVVAKPEIDVVFTRKEIVSLLILVMDERRDRGNTRPEVASVEDRLASAIRKQFGFNKHYFTDER